MAGDRGTWRRRLLLAFLIGLIATYLVGSCLSLALGVWYDRGGPVSYGEALLPFDIGLVVFFGGFMLFGLVVLIWREVSRRTPVGLPGDDGFYHRPRKGQNDPLRGSP